MEVLSSDLWRTVHRHSSTSQLLPATSIAPPFPNITMNPTPKVRAPAVPIETLHTDAAKFYTHIHPVLVLSLYALRFNAIVADPVPALLRTLVPLAALQIAYVAICLPPTGGSTAIVEKKKPGEKKKVAERGLSRSIIVRLPCPCPSISSHPHLTSILPCIAIDLV
jgi:phosphatidylinositol glycan class F